MKTSSVMVQNLCAPCACRCRYCLLSWDGRPVGIEWERSTAFVLRFQEETKRFDEALPVSFSFGYSMEHPRLIEAIRFLRSVGSPQASFLQCDGMKLRSKEECRLLMEQLAREGIKTLSFTFYGLGDYHDRFAGRNGDFAGLLRMISAASEIGLHSTARIPLTKESIVQTDELIPLLKSAGTEQISLFIPHEEGRGASIAPIRLEARDLSVLSEDALALLNRRIYRPESEWIADPDLPEETQRTLLISLRTDTIDRYEQLRAEELIREIEALDDTYYAAFPDFAELARRYGDPDSDKLYHLRDLALHYRRLFAQEYGLMVYDVTDERQSGSRRF